MIDSVKLQELLDDPNNVFMIVTVVTNNDGSVSAESEATYQKVKEVISACDRPLPNPNLYLGFKDFDPGATIKGSPLFVLTATSSNEGGGYQIISTTPELINGIDSKLVFKSHVMLAIKEGGAYLLRGMAYSSNIRVEV